MTICFCANPHCQAAGKCLGSVGAPYCDYRGVMDNAIFGTARERATMLDGYIQAVLESSNRELSEYVLQQWTEWEDGKMITCSRLVPSE
jgi:hypothetical protein